MPTLKELGYDVEFSLWVGMFAPKGTPANVTTTIRSTIDKAAHSSAFVTAMSNLGQDLAYLDGPDFQKFWNVDGKRVDEAVKAIGRVQGETERDIRWIAATSSLVPPPPPPPWRPAGQARRTPTRRTPSP